MRIDDVTEEAAGFWRLSGHYSELLLRERSLPSKEIRARNSSVEWQRRFYSAYLNRQVENLLLRFRKRDR